MTVSDLCKKIAGLQEQARKQAEEVSTSLEDPTELIDTLRDQIATVSDLQKCVADLTQNSDGLTKPELERLQTAFKELADLTQANHQHATRKGIRLTPGVQPQKHPGAYRGK